MAEQRKVEYRQLDAGYQFPPSGCQVDAATASAYLGVVEETSHLYWGTGLVPPMAVAALVMALLSEHISFPAGAIHVSQELEFNNTVSTSDILTSHAGVVRKQDRGKLCLLTIDLNVFNQAEKEVLTGKTSLVLPKVE